MGLKPKRAEKGTAAADLATVSTHLLDLYGTSLSAAGKNASSIAKYLKNLELFLGYCERPPAEITPDLISQFLIDIRRRRSAATVNQYKASIRGFFRYLLDTDKLVKDPSRLVQHEKIERADPPVFSQKQLDALLGTIKTAIGSPPKYQAARDFALYSLGYQVGLRPGVELLALNIKDVENKEWLTVLGKRKKKRTIPLNTAAQALISDYLPVRRGLRNVDEKALFVNRFGRRLGLDGLEENLKAWLKRAGIAEDFWPHLLRHTFATVFQERNKDLRLTQEMLGHASPTTSAIYAHARPDALRAAAEVL